MISALIHVKVERIEDIFSPRVYAAVSLFACVGVDFVRWEEFGFWKPVAKEAFELEYGGTGDGYDVLVD